MAKAILRENTGDWFAENAPPGSVVRATGTVPPREAPVMETVMGARNRPGPTPPTNPPPPPDDEIDPVPRDDLDPIVDDKTGKHGQPPDPSLAATPVGWDPAKWATEQTPKYIIGRILAKYAPNAEGVKQAMDEIKKFYPNATFDGRDSISFGGALWEGLPMGPVDVIGNAGASNSSWVWYPHNERVASSGGGANTLNAFGTGQSYSGGYNPYYGTTGGTTTGGTTMGSTPGYYSGTPGAYGNPIPGAVTNTGANGGTYWQAVDVDEFGSLIQPWNIPFSYPTFQPPAEFTPPSMGEVQNEPGFQMRLTEGQRALERSAAASGTLLTGGTLKGLDDYAQGMAANEYQNVYNRRAGEWTTNYNKALQDYTTNYSKALGEYRQAHDIYTGNVTRPYNMMSGLAGLGQVSANQLGSAGLGYSGQVGSTLGQLGSNVGNLYTQIGNANAAGAVGGWNAWSGALSGIGNNLLDYYAGRASGYTPN